MPKSSNEWIRRSKVLAPPETSNVRWIPSAFFKVLWYAAVQYRIQRDKGTPAFSKASQLSSKSLNTFAVVIAVFLIVASTRFASEYTFENV